MTTWWIVAFVAQWVLLVVLAIVVVALARQVGTLHLRLGLPSMPMRRNPTSPG